MNGKGSRRRPGKIPDDCSIWKDYKPPYQKTEDELATGHFVMGKDGKLVEGHARQADNVMMKSISFGRHKGEQEGELKRLADAGIHGCSYDSGGALCFPGGFQTQKKLAKLYGGGALGID